MRGSPQLAVMKGRSPSPNAFKELADPIHIAGDNDQQ